MNTDWSVKRVFFLKKILLEELFLLKELFFVTMASRFEIVDEEYIEELKEKNENKSTKNITEYWKNVFKKLTNERNFQANLQEYESDFLDQTMSQFYAFRNSESVTLPFMLLASNRSGSSLARLGIVAEIARVAENASANFNPSC